VARGPGGRAARASCRTRSPGATVSIIFIQLFDLVHCDYNTFDRSLTKSSCSRDIGVGELLAIGAGPARFRRYRGHRGSPAARSAPVGMLLCRRRPAVTAGATIRARMRGLCVGGRRHLGRVGPSWRVIIIAIEPVTHAARAPVQRAQRVGGAGSPRGRPKSTHGARGARSFGQPPGSRPIPFPSLVTSLGPFLFPGTPSSGAATPAGPTATAQAPAGSTDPPKSPAAAGAAHPGGAVASMCAANAAPHKRCVRERCWRCSPPC
jgi:hypothetical protein